MSPLENASKPLRTSSSFGWAMTPPFSLDSRASSIAEEAYDFLILLTRSNLRMVGTAHGLTPPSRVDLYDQGRLYLWVPDIRSPHATRAYSWISPPSRSRRATVPAGPVTKAVGSPGPSGGSCPKARWGRWPLQGRPGARCPPLDGPVSPDRPPNPACQSSRHRALHEARYQTNGCVGVRLRSTQPLQVGTPVFTGCSCPADPPRLSRCAPLPCGRLSRPRRLLRALRHDPPPTADDAPARRTKASRAATGRLSR
jgi:hypothetical protein